MRDHLQTLQVSMCDFLDMDTPDAPIPRRLKDAIARTIRVMQEEMRKDDRVRAAEDESIAL